MAENLNLLIMFAKNPEKEKVKTRLARKIGGEKAKRIYDQLLFKNICIHSRVAYDFMIYAQGDLEYFSNVKAKKQMGTDLGERMLNSFKEELQYYDRVVLVGSDLIVENTLVERAFEELEKCDVVIGPANDGGYYLIGMKKADDVFSNVRWSTSTVFEETVQKMKSKLSHTARALLTLN